MTTLVVHNMVRALRPTTVNLSQPPPCSADAELFWPVTEDGPARLQIARAKAVCAACPQRAPCLAHALASPEPHGIWGGTTGEERAAMLRHRRGTAHLPVRRSA